MKVNIIGKGPIPGINALAPVYNQELDKNQIKRILNYQEFKVYGANGIGLITKRSIDRIFDSIVESNDIDSYSVKTPVSEIVDNCIDDTILNNKERNDHEITNESATQSPVDEISDDDVNVNTTDDGDENIVATENVNADTGTVDEDVKSVRRNNYNKNRNKKKSHYKN